MADILKPNALDFITAKPNVRGFLLYCNDTSAPAAAISVSIVRCTPLSPVSSSIAAASLRRSFS